MTGGSLDARVAGESVAQSRHTDAASTTQLRMRNLHLAWRQGTHGVRSRPAARKHSNQCVPALLARGGGGRSGAQVLASMEEDFAGLEQGLREGIHAFNPSDLGSASWYTRRLHDALVSGCTQLSMTGGKELGRGTSTRRLHDAWVGGRRCRQMRMTGGRDNQSTSCVCSNGQQRRAGESIPAPPTWRGCARAAQVPPNAYCAAHRGILYAGDVLPAGEQPGATVRWRKGGASQTPCRAVERCKAR